MHLRPEEKFMILGSASLFKCLTICEAVEIVSSRLLTRRGSARNLITASLKKISREQGKEYDKVAENSGQLPRGIEHEPITAMVVFFNPDFVSGPEFVNEQMTQMGSIKAHSLQHHTRSKLQDIKIM
ncbi:hypothetical protein PIB30_112982 [Stylosanthes scabra]|uniref:Uncharacterized protein n=1 Tax=Stylosanthes scabra TaxID=79078 RepID=A0ABU6R1L9_9FABA|nr:hypothetical protein [Stylosanthes scabra]